MLVANHRKERERGRISQSTRGGWISNEVTAGVGAILVAWVDWSVNQGMEAETHRSVGGVVVCVGVCYSAYNARKGYY